MNYKDLADAIFPNITKTIADYEKEYPERIRMTRSKPRIEAGLNGEDIYYIYFEDALGNLLINLYSNGIKPTTISLDRISAYGRDVANLLNSQGFKTYSVESLSQVISFVSNDKEKRFTENTRGGWKVFHIDGKHNILVGINSELDTTKLIKAFRSNMPCEMKKAFMNEEINENAVKAFKQDSYSLTLKPSKKNEQ